MDSYIGRSRWLKNPETGEKVEASVIRDEIYFPAANESEYDSGDWGKYRFGAWLEEDKEQLGSFIISFPYWRNGRFAGQFTLRAEPYIIRKIFEEIQARGWFEKEGY